MQQYLIHPKKTITGRSKKVHCNMFLPDIPRRLHQIGNYSSAKFVML